MTAHVFPLVETAHLLALTVLLGTILQQNLRLLGISPSYWAPAGLARQMNRLTIGSLAIIAVTGYLLFTTEADLAYTNPAFFWKMVLLFAALIQHFGLHVRTQRIDAERIPVWAKLSAVLSLALWFGVGVMGRAIGFV